MGTDTIEMAKPVSVSTSITFSRAFDKAKNGPSGGAATEAVFFSSV
jgi:hypothetical protein